MSERSDMHPNRDYLEDLGYEQRDVVVGALGKWILGYFALMAFGALAAMGVYFLYVPLQAEKVQSWPMSTVRQFPPGPRVQANPVRDMREFKDGEIARLGAYGWVDRAHGTVSIPVDRATDLAMQQGFPTRHGPVPPPAAGTADIPGALGMGLRDDPSKLAPYAPAAQPLPGGRAPYDTGGTGPERPIWRPADHD